MKLNLITALFSVAILAASGYSQTSGGTGGGTTPPGAPTGPTSPGAGGTPPPTLNPGIGENSFEAQRRTQPATPTLPPDQSGQIGVTNTIAITNQFGATNLTPTSQPGFTNRIMATNAQVLLTNGSRFMRDQALSEADRQLLGQIRTAVFGGPQATASSAGTEVHFILRDGAVRIVGFVSSPDDQKRIETAVQQVPGVVRVYNALQVGASAVPNQTSAPGQTPSPGQTPTPGQPQ
jgi:hypothetical protein